MTVRFFGSARSAVSSVISKVRQDVLHAVRRSVEERFDRRGLAPHSDPAPAWWQAQAEEVSGW
jgi:hypothetical protein